MNPIDDVMDAVRASDPGSAALAIGEARLRLDLWRMMPTAGARRENVELLEEASTMLGELALMYRET